MTIKTKVTKEEFDALPDALKEHYKELNGSYVLDSDDAEELRTAAAKAREERDAAKARLDELTAEKEAAEKAKREAEEANARKKGDIEAIENSWKAKVEEAKTAGETRATRLETMLRELLVDNKAIALANEVSTAPDLILPHIKARLMAELDGDKPVTRVLDAEGKPTALTVEELSAELVANPKFAAIIKGSDANGGGAGGKHLCSGATGADFHKLTQAERTALYNKVGPTEFRRIAAAAGVVIPT